MRKGNKRDFVRRAAEAPVRHAESVLGETRDLLQRNGELKPGQAMVTTALSLALGFLCLLAVIAFPSTF